MLLGTSADRLQLADSSGGQLPTASPEGSRSSPRFPGGLKGLLVVPEGFQVLPGLQVVLRKSAAPYPHTLPQTWLSHL